MDKRKLMIRKLGRTPILHPRSTPQYMSVECVEDCFRYDHDTLHERVKEIYNLEDILTWKLREIRAERAYIYAFLTDNPF